MNRPALHPVTAHFLAELTGAVVDTLRAWGSRSPEALVGLCPRHPPVGRDGSPQRNVDEALWLRGRARYGARR